MGRTVAPRDVVVTVCVSTSWPSTTCVGFVETAPFCFSLRGACGRSRTRTWVPPGTTRRSGSNGFIGTSDRATEYFAAKVVEALGASALQLSQSQAVEEKAKRDERKALHDDIERLI